VSAAAEFDTHPGPVKALIARFQRDWMQVLEGLVVAAQADGSLDADEDPAQLAFELDAFLLMANSAFLLHDDGAALSRARSALATRRGMARRA
jgi:hypothetical protein